MKKMQPLDRPPVLPPQEIPVAKDLSQVRPEPEIRPVFDEEPKWALRSKGILGPLFILIGMALKLAGVELDLEPLQVLVETVLNDGTVTAAAVLALIGRYAASRKVVLWPPKRP